MKKSSVFLLACVIALGSVGCGGSGKTAAPLTTREAAVVGVVGADAWYPTLTSLIYVLNGIGTFPSARSGSPSVNIQNWSLPLMTNQRELGLFLDEYTGYFVGFELQSPNTALMKLYESDSSSSAVKGTGTLIRKNTESGLNYSLSYEIPGGRRVLKALIELNLPTGTSTYNYKTQYILCTGANKRVVEGNGMYSFFNVAGDMAMKHNGRITNFQNIGITGAGAMEHLRLMEFPGNSEGHWAPI